MDPGRTRRTLFRFGVYEVDNSSGELRKSGVRLHLQGQPFQFLVMLLERPGQVVTREELRQRLWPANTFVDFDHSIKYCRWEDSRDAERFKNESPVRRNSGWPWLPLCGAGGVD